MKICTRCQKGSVRAGKRSFLRSHYNPTATIRKYPNIQWVSLPDGKRVKMCVKCMRTLQKV